MPEFLINANDAIVSGHPYAELNEFARGYVEAMFFTNCDSGDDNEFRANELGVDALTDDSVSSIRAMCAKFENDMRHILERAYEWSDGAYDVAAAGRDFWFTAQGHGVGYWDRAELDHTCNMQGETLRDVLTREAKSYGEQYPEIGDDDRIYFRWS